MYPPPVPSLPMNLDIDAILTQMPVCDEWGVDKHWVDPSRPLQSRTINTAGAMGGGVGSSGAEESGTGGRGPGGRGAGGAAPTSQSAPR